MSSRRVEVYSRIYGDRIGDLTSTDPEEVVEDILKADPTGGRYLEWLIKQYIARLFRLEDVERVRDDLTLYNRNLSKFNVEDRDINRFVYGNSNGKKKSLKVFLDDNFKTNVTVGDVISTTRDVRVLVDSVAGSLSVPLTKRGSCELGRGTRWCTSGKEGNMFEQYNKDGLLYVFVDRIRGAGGINDKFQFQFESGMFMDSRDDPLEDDIIEYYRKEHPITSPIFKYYEDKFIEEGDFDSLLSYYRGIGYDERIERVLSSYPEYVLTMAHRRGRVREYEHVIATSPRYSFLYALDIIRGRWEEGEEMISTSPIYSYLYSSSVVKGEWKRGEKAIATSPLTSYLYSLTVVKGRWERGERSILDDPYLLVEDGYDGDYEYDRNYRLVKKSLRGLTTSRYAEFLRDVTVPQLSYVGIMYTLYCLRDRWYALEDVMKDLGGGDALALYSIEVLKERWIEMEPIILSTPSSAALYGTYIDIDVEDYVKRDYIQALIYTVEVKKNRWYELEESILSGGETSMVKLTRRYKRGDFFSNIRAAAAEKYARYIIGDRWYEAEPIILKSPVEAASYSLHVIKGRWIEAEEIISRDPYASTIYKKVK